MLSLLLHAADISHPTKQWSVHSRWTKALMEEFFRQVGLPWPWGQGGGTRGGPPCGDTSPLPCQGDKEAELGLPFSPLCDRTSTLVAQSQIGEWRRVPRPHHPWPWPGMSPSLPCPFPTTGFIDFIVEPTFSVLTDVAEKMVLPLAEDGTKAKGNPVASQQARSAMPPCLSFPFLMGRFWGSAWGGEHPLILGLGRWWLCPAPSCPCPHSSQWRQPSLDDHLELGDIKADLAGFRSTWAKYIQENKQKWKERAASGR